MAWEVSVAGVVEVFSDTVDQWIVELIENIVLKNLIILDTITVQVGDSATVPSLFAKGGLNETQVLWGLNIVDEECESGLLAKLHVLVITNIVGHFSIHFLLAQVLSGQLRLGEGLWWLWKWFLCLLGWFLFSFLRVILLCSNLNVLQFGGQIWDWIWLVDWNEGGIGARFGSIFVTDHVVGIFLHESLDTIIVILFVVIEDVGMLYNGLGCSEESADH